ncbi:MAG: nuclear transport factor 2 family protein [Acidobacteriaceae bacterium]|nr:nuclear transport factor 2 family protein [Acidobacteriaceae bacterium]
MTKAATIALVAGAAAWIAPLRAQQACEGALLSQKDADAIVQEFESKYTRAFNRGDIQAVISLYREDATMVTEAGALLVGHSSIEDALACALAASDGHLENTPAHSAIISSDVIITQGKARTVLASAGDQPPPIVYTQVLARQGDQWRLVAVQYGRVAGQKLSASAAGKRE